MSPKRSYICEGCPVEYGISSEIARVKAGEETTLKVKMCLTNCKLGEVALNRGAKEIDCRSIEKDLPPLPAEIPPTGSPEAIALAQACPAFGRYVANFERAAQERAEQTLIIEQQQE